MERGSDFDGDMLHTSTCYQSRDDLGLGFIIGGSCHKYHFCRDKSMLIVTKVVATSILLSREKTCFVVTNTFFVATNTCLSRQKLYLWQLPSMVVFFFSLAGMKNAVPHESLLRFVATGAIFTEIYFSRLQLMPLDGAAELIGLNVYRAAIQRECRAGDSSRLVL